MNIEGLAHFLLVCVIIIAMCSITLAFEVRADLVDSAIDIPESIPEAVEAPVTPELKEDINEPDEKVEDMEVVQEPVVVNVKDAMDTIKGIIRDTCKSVDDHPFSKYYKVPLSPEIQDHIFAVCEEYDIEPEIIIAMIRKESNFEIDILGDNGAAFGLLQVHPRWHQERMDRLGVTDLMDPCQNITVAVDYLAECIRLGRGSLDWGLMAYNGGPSYAREMWAKGEVSYYAQIVQKWARAYATD